MNRMRLTLPLCLWLGMELYPITVRSVRPNFQNLKNLD